MAAAHRVIVDAAYRRVPPAVPLLPPAPPAMPSMAVGVLPSAGLPVVASVRYIPTAAGSAVSCWRVHQPVNRAQSLTYADRVLAAWAASISPAAELSSPSSPAVGASSPASAGAPSAGVLVALSGPDSARGSSGGPGGAREGAAPPRDVGGIAGCHKYSYRGRDDKHCE